MLVLLNKPTYFPHSAPHCEFLKRNKFDLCLALLRDGWSHGGALGCWKVGEPRVFNLSIKRPVSYFAALCSADVLVEKGVDCIYHDKCDDYYRCILHLKGAKLLHVLANVCEVTNSWFHTQLEGFQSGEPAEHAVAVPLGLEADELPDCVDLPSPLASSLDLALWQRCLVDMGPNTPSLKVYFDNASHTSGYQRGFCNCEQHQCIRYIFCHGFSSKLDFVTDMYLWHQLGENLEAVPDKATHLALKVDFSQIEAQRSQIRMRDF